MPILVSRLGLYATLGTRLGYLQIEHLLQGRHETELTFRDEPDTSALYSATIHNAPRNTFPDLIWLNVCRRCWLMEARNAGNFCTTSLYAVQ